MNKSKDPFEAAYEEQDEEEEETPPESPVGADDLVLATDTASAPAAPASQDPDESAVAQEEYGDIGPAGGDGVVHSGSEPSATTTPMLMGDRHNKGKTISANAKEDYDDDEEDNMDVELSKFPSSADPHKMAKMQSILSQFTEEQMSRYESFRRSALQRANMRRLLVSITGTQKISLPMTIVVCGIAKMFVGELVETARIVMTERKESGPIRPCHIREAYRRLKLEGKVPKRSVPRLFR